MDEKQYELSQPEKAAFEERMALTSFKGKAVSFAVRAELAGSRDVGMYYAAIAQTYATLELARVTAAQKPKK
jgi:hypothetical protein